MAPLLNKTIKKIQTMKTTFLKIATLLFMITVGNRSFAANSGNAQQYTELTWINNFYKVEVHGNVQLHLVSGEKSKVEMSGTYYDHNALVQVEDGVLRITCYRKERLDVWVTVNDLHALSAYDNVLVQTEGKFSDLELYVELFNNAKADLDLDCCSANIKLSDRSIANISGRAIESELVSNYGATLNSTNFSANEISKERIAPMWEMRIEFIGCLGEPSSGSMDDNQPRVATVKELRFPLASTKQIKLDIPADVNAITITQSLVN
jgi:hypothetical protein